MGALKSLGIPKFSSTKWYQISALINVLRKYPSNFKYSKTSVWTVMNYYKSAALNAKGGCISATRERVIVCRIGKTLGMKSTVQGIHIITSAPVLKLAICMKTLPLTEKTKHDCQVFGYTSYIYLHLLSLLFLATVVEESSLSVDFTTATT